LKNSVWEVESIKIHTDSIWQYPNPIESWADEFILRFLNNSKMDLNIRFIIRDGIEKMNVLKMV
jgi:hypothetical protein